MKKAVIILGILVVASGGYLYWNAQPKGSDEEQIRQVLVEIQEGVRNQNLRAVTSHISKDYSGVGGNKTQARLQLLQVFRDTAKTSVTLNEPQIRVTGETANVDVFANGRMESESGAIADYSADLSLELSKESTKRYLFIPVRTWKITGGTMESRTGIENLF